MWLCRLQAEIVACCCCLGGSSVLAEFRQQVVGSGGGGYCFFPRVLLKCVYRKKKKIRIFLKVDFMFVKQKKPTDTTLDHALWLVCRV